MTRCPLPSYGGAGNEQPPAVRVLRRVTSSSQVVCALLLYLCRLWLRIDAGRACGLCNVSDTILPRRRVATVAKALRESPWETLHARPNVRSVAFRSFHAGPTLTANTQAGLASLIAALAGQGRKVSPGGNIHKFI